MLYGKPPEGVRRADPLTWSLAPLTVNFALLLVLGLTLPPAFLGALKQVLQTIG